jgi:hypothetical protein
MAVSNRQRIVGANPGPWGPTDGPHAGGSPASPQAPNLPLASSAALTGGMALVRANDRMAVVDALPFDGNGQPITDPVRGSGDVYAAGRLSGSLPGVLFSALTA